VILQNADYENRFPLLEQLNQMVEENISTEGVVISAGMAELTPEDDYVEDVFKRADHLMYVRKQQLKEMGARMRT
jgi:PleD family two-component response regulator